MSENQTTTKRKVSALSEFSALSAGIVTVLLILFVFSVAFYIWSAIPPSKTYKVEDDAHLFSASEEKAILSQARRISRDKDINVMIVTTDDKGSGYDWSEEGSAEFAQDKFKELTKFKTFRDNSGVLILIDMEYRFFYICTFGTAKASITNGECTDIYESMLPELQSDEFAEAVEGSLDQVEDHEFFSGLLVFTYASFIVGPLLIVFLVLWILSHKRRTKVTVTHKTYFDSGSTTNVEDQDIFERKTVTVTTSSSGSGISGGGFSGGGFSGGGGGGGGSFGGGGGRF